MQISINLGDVFSVFTIEILFVGRAMQARQARVGTITVGQESAESTPQIREVRLPEGNVYFC